MWLSTGVCIEKNSERMAGRARSRRFINLAEVHDLIFDSDVSDSDFSLSSGAGLLSSEESELDGLLAGGGDSGANESDDGDGALEENDDEEDNNSSSLDGDDDGHDDDPLFAHGTAGRGARGRGGLAHGRGAVRGAACGGAASGGGRARGGRGRGRGGLAVGRGRGAACGRGARGRGARGRGRGGLQGANPAGDEPLDPVYGWSDDDDDALDHEDFHPNRDAGLHLPENFAPTGPLDFFRLFFPCALLQAIAGFTNVYAAAKIVNKPAYGDKDGAWLEVTVEEMDRFIGLLIFMGFCRLSQHSCYWSTASLYHGNWARRLIPSSRRFKALLAFLHIVDHLAENPADKLRKVRTVYDHLRGACQAFYQPFQKLSVDERMVKSKARVSFKQYIKNKPVRWGFKLFALCCSKTSYLFDFKVYTGREGDGVQHGLAHDVVTDLCEPFTGQGYEVYTDQFYTSPALAHTLLAAGIRCAGTCLPNRKNFPVVLRNVKQWDKTAHRGDMRYVRRQELLHIQWKDKRTVSLVSTLHAAHEHQLVTRHTKQDGHHIELQVRQPRSVHEYNQYMGGVDSFDQLVGSYRVLRKTRKWWKTLFLDFIDVGATNAYLLYNMYASQPDTDLRKLHHLEFREQLVRQLGQIDVHEEIPRAPNAPKKRRADNLDRHPPGIVPSTHRRNCIVCYRMLHAERKTRHFCQTCVVGGAGHNAFLCIAADRNCWTIFHSTDFDNYR